jgi:hypothetical protein
VVRGLATAQGALEQEGELFPDPVLADELVEVPRAQGALDRPLVYVGQRRNDPVVTASDTASDTA